MNSKRMLKPVNDKPKEKTIETYLKSQVEKQGGICYKFTAPGRRSVPDRLCIFPTGVVIFVECKAPGKHPTIKQQAEIARIIKVGGLAIYMNSKEAIDIFIEQVRETINARTFGDQNGGLILRQQ